MLTLIPRLENANALGFPGHEILLLRNKTQHLQIAPLSKEII